MKVIGNFPELRDAVAERGPLRPLTRRERRIERMRTQYMGHAQRGTYRVSGSPVMARPGISRPDATIYNVQKGAVR